ncbi:MFS transporter [Solimonas sp. SE-A11]|uniref:POT-type proton-dependent oligopeptide transporter n=1 Tax=Solimonas sp. SE-A11 TaxID=3054954 RepID=UPI00259C9CE7|nr:MFS transporter [Solimonas sp. SE-A11]MDM4771564.1 MFS transporter [Solimonas sp. SE-A11]
MSTAPANRDSRMPAGIPYIISNEFAERFCFYGINAILSIYMVQFLHVGEAQATTWQSLFKSGAYFFPLVGAIVSDVFWGKFRTIITFSIAYSIGCAVLALTSDTTGLAIGLFLIAFGTGGIKPCVSTDVGDQFTSRNQHLIERAFSWFYLSINAGALISILLCPWLLQTSGPRWAFGIPAVAMALATLVFWLGRDRFAVVPPAGRQWLREVFSAEGAQLIGRLGIIYLFLAVFWSLFEQANGTTWTLQAQSSLMDKHLGFGIELLPAQIQFFNPLFILLLVPLFSYVIYPWLGKVWTVTPLRKIGIGFFVGALSFVLIAWIENRIQNGIVTSMWWQILAYAILTSGEVLVSVTALEYSYKQAPLRIKSFIMALYLLSLSVGNLLTAGVASNMVEPLQGVEVRTGAQTVLTLPAGSKFVPGQKIDFRGDNGVTVQQAGGKAAPLGGTYIVGEIREGQALLLDVVNRQPVAASGDFKAGSSVSTYKLVGPQFFMFFCYLMLGTGILWIFVATRVKEQTFVRQDA